MRNSDLFNEKFMERLTSIFPNATDWLTKDICPSVDIDTLLKNVGVTISPRSFKYSAQTDSRFVGHIDDDILEYGDSTIFVNTDKDAKRRRFVIAQYVCRKLIKDSAIQRHESKEVAKSPETIGKCQTVPEAVDVFLKNHQFAQLKENSLANIFSHLRNTVEEDVKEWWSQPDAEAKLANAYLFGFISEKKIVSKTDLKIKQLVTVINSQIVQNQLGDSLEHHLVFEFSKDKDLPDSYSITIDHITFNEFSPDMITKVSELLKEQPVENLVLYPSSISDVAIEFDVSV